MLLALCIIMHMIVFVPSNYIDNLVSGENNDTMLSDKADRGVKF